MDSADDLEYNKAHDYDEIAANLCSWIVDRVEDAGKSGGVLGLSGGLDSAVTAALIQRVFPENSLAVIMPCGSSADSIEDAELVAKKIGINVKKLQLDEVYDNLLFKLRKLEPGEDRLASANIKPRLRMTSLYYLAARRDALVIGTDNWSELTTGYFTKHGDGGVDIAPLGRLVKNEIRVLARHLGIPERIIEKKPTAGLWQDQSDEKEMGFSYKTLDRYILTGEAEPELEERIKKMKDSTRHKIEPPPVPAREKILGGD
ncbi:NAD(+) synthase [Halarsenatibacter silvermanii]|uniref:NH(3)-dependent NAD(+) synthetase n=1 Tax=Halarsenatibacter silvermanii TaxID=321763 RepID=A0A1G9I1H1_9FIRM|nr:NAD(+) synthase [Halarsenatibacter silvermanii]SDL19100.1 NAD+ synthase [Halarsenatibacter silvermanii]